MTTRQLLTWDRWGRRIATIALWLAVIMDFLAVAGLYLNASLDDTRWAIAMFVSSVLAFPWLMGKRKYFAHWEAQHEAELASEAI